jgi:hypothetical protein
MNRQAAVITAVLALTLGAGVPATAADTMTTYPVSKFNAPSVSRNWREGFVTGYVWGANSGITCKAGITGTVLLQKFDEAVASGVVKPTDGLSASLLDILFANGCTKD